MSNVAFKHIVSSELFESTKFAADSNNTSYYVGDDVGTLHFGTPDVLYQDVCFCKSKSVIYTHAQFYKCGSDGNGLKQVDCTTYRAVDGEIVQHIGATANGFVKGYIYQKTLNITKTIPSGTRIWKVYNRANNHLLVSFDETLNDEYYTTKNYTYTASDGKTIYKVVVSPYYYNGSLVGMYVANTQDTDDYFQIVSQNDNVLTLDNGVTLTMDYGGSGGSSYPRIWYDTVTKEQYYSVAVMNHSVVSKDYYSNYSGGKELLPTEPIGNSFGTISFEDLESDYVIGEDYWQRVNVQPMQLSINNNNVIYTDSANNSHILATKNDIQGTAPLGAILPFAGSTIPENWLLCDGSAISRTTYAELFALIGTQFGSGDGSSTFNLPDLREVVPVGAGTSTRSAIADHDTYDVGQFKDDQYEDHYHNVGLGANDSGFAYITYQESGGSGRSNYYRVQGNVNTNSVNGYPMSARLASGRKGGTTHGKQLGVNFIIRVLNGTNETTAQSINYNNIPIIFSQASSKQDLTSGDTLATLFGKIKKWHNTPTMKANANYVGTGNKLVITVYKGFIGYYQSVAFMICGHGNATGIDILRIKHDDSWYSEINNLVPNACLDVNSTTVDGDYVIVKLDVDISGNNKFTFNPLSGIDFALSVE